MNVYVLGTVEAGLDCLRLLAGRIPLRGVIGLAPQPPGDAISGYVHMAPAARELALEFVEVQDYRLRNQSDIERIQDLSIDVLLVLGWQRLIPDWLIRHCTVGAIGGHGSVSGITGGRGRSPQNWAIMLGATAFEISIFFIDAGVDSGDVIATQSFPLDDRDDIRGSYRKTALTLSGLIVDAFQDGSIATRTAAPQPSNALYLPQRLPEDGAIDWHRSTSDIDRFIRALTRPYPGAFTALEGRRLHLWRARPFQMNGPRRNEPGSVVAVFTDHSWIAATADGLLLVEDWSAEDGVAALASLRRGCALDSVSFPEQMRSIIKRHEARYPDLPLSRQILEAAEQ